MRCVLVAWAALAAAYLILVGQAGAVELVAAMLCGGLAALWSRAIRRASPRAFGFEAAAIRPAVRAVAGLPAATVRVGAVLLRAVAGRQPASRCTTQPFVHGRRDDPLACGRRAVAVLTASLAPERLVLRAPEGRDAIDLHSLTGRPTRCDPQWPT